MRNRRDANRDRLKDGLKKAEKPAPTDFIEQGSYAMRTMTQHPEKDYDIDDGVYFRKETWSALRGGEMTALEARQMVRDAVDDDSFNTPPEVKKNCVRVQYNAGYHVDLPVYRWVVTMDLLGREVSRHAELASSEWKRSDARDVTDWFDKRNQELSPRHGQWAADAPNRPPHQEVCPKQGELEAVDPQRVRHHHSGHRVLPQERRPRGRGTLRHDEGDARPAELESGGQAPCHARSHNHQRER